MLEDEHSKEGTISPHQEDDWQEPTIRLPRVKANQLRASEVGLPGSSAIDETPTSIVRTPGGSAIDETPTSIVKVSKAPGGLATDETPTSIARVPRRLTIDQMPTWILPIIRLEPDTEPHEASVAGEESLHAPVLNLIKSSGIYAIASVGAPLVVLVLAPFLTHHLSPSDYGLLTILNTLISLGAGITQLGLGSAFFRAYGYDYTSHSDRRDVVATITTLLCIISIPTVIGVIILAPGLATIFFGRPSLGNLLALAGGIVLLQNLTVPGFAWLRAGNHPLFYSLLGIGNVLIALIANIVLVGMFHLGVEGSLIGTGCGYASVTLCMMPIILIRAGIRIRFDIARSVLAFGSPFVFNVVSNWLLDLSDRYLLSLFGSLSQTAMYAAAYMLGSAISVVVIGPFSLAWPAALFAIARRADAPEIFRLAFRWFSLLLLFAAFGLSIVGTAFLDLLFPVVYHSVALIIPIVATSLTFYGVYIVFMVGVNVKRRTWLGPVFTTIAAIVNVALNLFLIPRYGAMGAALSTLLAYAALAGVAYIVNQRIYRIPFEIGLFVIALLIGTAFYVGSTFLGRGFGIYEAWGISICALICYGGCLALLGKLLPARRH